MTNTVDTKPETKTMNTVEAYNEGFLHGVSFCKKYGIPSETTSTTPIEDKGWEILTWFSREGEVALLVCGEIEGNLYAGYKIRSVRRTSDNEVFTVGKFNNGKKIEKFYIGWSGMEIHYTDGSGSLLLEEPFLPQQPPPKTQDKGNVLFTTGHWEVLQDALSKVINDDLAYDEYEALRGMYEKDKAANIILYLKKRLNQ